MPGRNRNPSLGRSLSGAWAGLAAAYRKEPNLRFHLAAAWLALGLAWAAALAPLEWIALIILIGVVVFAELVNTAMERLGDREAGEETCLLVGEAKQVAAGAVLVVALAAVAGGCLLFGPKLALMAGRVMSAGRYPLPTVIYLAVMAVLAWLALEARRHPRGER